MIYSLSKTLISIPNYLESNKAVDYHPNFLLDLYDIGVADHFVIEAVDDDGGGDGDDDEKVETKDLMD
ncbi:hypothetical protein QR98_0016890 [Sarcoptes scabiei]|uniref:Uncharacterized protein n=1 Tax=Sarcoptes scabiei TaxID=52283 RepID=A0A131ZXN2_SARSC|nr:hypothetical protein QR98_0016890 [Sarcoptes scabiei]